MRKLSELLPIARQFLWDGTGPAKFGVRHAPGQCRLCYAAEAACTAGVMTDPESYAVQEAICARIHPNAFLVSKLLAEGRLEQNVHASDLDYIPHRDKWLDDWQAKLEGAGQ